LTVAPTIVGWLSSWARARPADAALIDASGECWTYGRLLDEVERRATYLLAQGVSAGDIIAIQTALPLEQRLLRWAGQRIGAVEAVLDPRLATQEQAIRLQILAPRVVLRDPLPAWSATPTTLPEPARDGRARILFTTGSTGPPRAVIQRHAHLEQVAAANIEARGLHSRDVYLAALPAFHAAGSLFEDSVIRLGATLSLPPRGTPGWLRAALDMRIATVTSLVPSMLRELVDSEGGLEALNSLRLLNYAGEPMPVPLLTRLLKGFRGQVFRGYGATEAGPLIAVLDDVAHRRAVPEPGNVGRPAPGVELRVDATESDGVGELLVRSPWLMEGYLGNEEATRSRLVDGWLRTGDLAHLRDGMIHLAGRRETRIRSGGEWIDPGAIETCLLDFPGIEEAVVIGVADARWGERPVAYVRASGDITVPLLQTHLGASLASFAWPDRIQILDELPHTSTGKIDRRALAALDLEHRLRGSIILRN
jgi:acyl-CoA synthetase (AMP-forming)/AMP-acid ligase II